MSFSVRDPDAVPAWQQRALERALAQARDRSVERLSDLVDAARQLATETGSADFTVQQVVQRAGQSLKSFYRYFEGKDSLLLALIEEDTLIGVELLRQWVDDHDEPIDRLRAFVTGLSTFGSVGDRSYVSVLLRERRRLDEADPVAMAAALAPFLDQLVELLHGARVAGELPAGSDERDALTIFNLVISNIATVVGSTDAVADETADYIWNFCLGGLRAAQP
jgi:AcrR family transcriptional regulator